MAGSIYILPPERVHPVDISFTKAIGVFSKWGMGAGEFVRAMKTVPVVQAAAQPRPQPSASLHYAASRDGPPSSL